MRYLPAWLMFVGAFAIYNLNLRPVPSGDTLPAALLPVALYRDGGATFDRLQPELQRLLPYPLVMFEERGGHVYSDYPIALPLAISPLYAPLAWAGVFELPPETLVPLMRMLEKVAASLLAAATVAVFYALLLRMMPAGAAAAFALLFAVGTSLWSIASQALWQHTGTCLAAAVMLNRLWSVFCRNSARQPNSIRRDAFLAGLAAGFGLAVRPTGAIPAALAWGVLLWDGKRREAAWFAVGPLVFGAATLAYNLSVFHRASGGYDPYGPVFFWEALAGLWISPSRGLLVFTPVFLLAFAGLRLWHDPAMAPMVRLAALAVAAHGIAVSFWPTWWGGYCFGPRMMTDVAPMLALLTALGWERVRASGALRAGVWVLAAWSVGVQYVGAFHYPKGRWDHTPEPVNAARVWDWRDSQIAREWAAGPFAEHYRYVATALRKGWREGLREMRSSGRTAW